MKKYTVLGNCQSTSIVNYLNSSDAFSNKYQYLPLPPVHTIRKDVDTHLLNIFREVDLLIYQPVTDVKRFGPFTSDSVKALMKPGSDSISLPSLYYSGYFPTLGSIEGINGTLRGVHDFVVVACYLSGFDEDEAVAMLSSEFLLNKDDIFNFHVKSLDSLRSREIHFDVDIPVSAFIESNYKTERLFHTFNHPSPKLIKYVCQNIISAVGVSGSFDENDYLGSVIAPIYEPVYTALDLDFHLDGKHPILIKRGEETFSLRQMVSNDYDIYRNSDADLLKHKLFQKKRFLVNHFNAIVE